MSDDDVKVTSLRYALLPPLRTFLDKEQSREHALILIARALEQAVAVAIEPPRSWHVEHEFREALGDE